MIKVYATSQNGEGYTMLLGTFESIEDIELRCEMFEKDIVFTFENNLPSMDDEES